MTRAMGEPHPRLLRAGWDWQAKHRFACAYGAKLKHGYLALVKLRSIFPGIMLYAKGSSHRASAVRDALRGSCRFRRQLSDICMSDSWAWLGYSEGEGRRSLSVDACPALRTLQAAGQADGGCRHKKKGQASMTNMRIRRRRARSRNRTRTLFYVFLAIMLAVIALSLSAQIIDSAVLLQIYIAATILSIGVIVIDMMGFLGAQHGDDGGYDSAASDDAGYEAWDDGASDTAGADGGSFDSEGGAVGTGHDDAYHDPHENVPLHDVDHDSVIGGRGPVLEAIRYLRMFVYFCLGFGLVGLALLTTQRTPQASLLFASMAGLGTVFLARTFYRFQPQDTGDILTSDELLMEQGVVTVPLSHDSMGQMRVQIGVQVHEPYARAAHEGESYGRGERVRIVEVSDECVFVEGV